MNAVTLNMNAVTPNRDSARPSPRPSSPSEPAESLRKLVEQNTVWLRGWLATQLFGVHRQELDDLCHDILVRALGKGHGLRDRSKFPAWLYRIARNVVTDYRRRMRNAPQPLEADTVVDRRTAKNPVEENDEFEFVTTKLMALPKRYREPMLLRHVDDLSYAKIGRILGIPENTVHVRIHRARRILRKACRQTRSSSIEDRGDRKK